MRIYILWLELVIPLPWAILRFRFFSDEDRGGQPLTITVSLREPYTEAIFQENTHCFFLYNFEPQLLLTPRHPGLAKLGEL